MGQLDIYPCDILKCLRYEEDPLGHNNWLGNDCMVLAFIWDHIYTSEAQCIASCNTSAEAYDTLHRHHEKHSGLVQIQLIQKMMQVQFNNSSGNCDVTMAHLRDLIHHAEKIGPVDITRLALLFSLINLRSMHPSIHEALVPALMDGTITLDALESCLHYFYELQATQNPDPLAFPALLLMPMQPPPPNHVPITLPAGIPPCVTIFPFALAYSFSSCDSRSVSTFHCTFTIRSASICASALISHLVHDRYNAPWRDFQNLLMTSDPRAVPWDSLVLFLYLPFVSSLGPGS
ncbi:hypothetical protein EDB89DRAFT_2063224 [Lactarius sanguifluus]|nr:hypothetical protein EDB89DRAFT_2063224 [Lactarius sanguifluus]